MATKKTSSLGTKVGIGTGLAALAAAAAGAYYFYGSKDASKNRKAMKSWMVKAQGEVMERMEKLKDVSQENYDTIIKQVAEKYGKMKNIDPAELTAMVGDMKRHWKSISSHLNTAPKKAAARKPAAKSKAKKSK